MRRRQHRHDDVSAVLGAESDAELDAIAAGDDDDEREPVEHERDWWEDRAEREPITTDTDDDGEPVPAVEHERDWWEARSEREPHPDGDAAELDDEGGV